MKKFFLKYIFVAFLMGTTSQTFGMSLKPSLALPQNFPTMQMGTFQNAISANSNALTNFYENHPFYSSVLGVVGLSLLYKSGLVGKITATIRQRPYLSMFLIGSLEIGLIHLNHKKIDLIRQSAENSLINLLSNQRIQGLLAGSAVAVGVPYIALSAYRKISDFFHQRQSRQVVPAVRGSYTTNGQQQSSQPKKWSLPAFLSKKPKPSKDELLQLAVQKEQLGEVKRLLAQHADPNWQDSNKQTTMHHAAKIGNFDLVRLLRNHNASVDMQDINDVTPLMIAVENGHVAIARFLLEQGVDPNNVDTNGQIAIDYIFKQYLPNNVQVELVRLLFEYGLDITTEMTMRLFNLHYDCQLESNFDLLKIILEKSIAANALDYTTLPGTVLHKVIMNGWNDIARILILHMDTHTFNIRDFQGYTPLIMAVMFQNAQIVDCILNRDASSLEIATYEGKTAIMIACEEGNLAIVRRLAQAGAGLDATCPNNGYSPLHYAAEGGHADIVRFLCLKGVKLDEQQNIGFTPLVLACVDGHKKVIEVLLSFDTDRSQNFSRNLALTYALLSQNSEIISLFKKYLPDNNVIDECVQNEEPNILSDNSELYLRAKSMMIFNLGIAQNNLEMISMALSEGADVNAIDNKGRTPLMKSIKKQNQAIIDECLNAGAYVIVADNEGNTPLHYAAEYGDSELMKKLIEKGAAVNAKNNNDDTPLHKAVIYEKVDNVKALLTYNADVNTVDKTYGHTPLSQAVAQNNLQIVQLLRTKNAQINVKDAQGLSPLDYAQSLNNLEMIQYLSS